MKLMYICAVFGVLSLVKEMRGEEMSKELFVKTTTNELMRVQSSWKIGYECVCDFEKATNLVAKVLLINKGMTTNDIVTICGEPDRKNQWRGKSSNSPLKIEYVYSFRRRNKRIVNVYDQYLGLYFDESGILDSVVFPCGTASYEVDFKSDTPASISTR